MEKQTVTLAMSDEAVFGLVIAGVALLAAILRGTRAGGPLPSPARALKLYPPTPDTLGVRGLPWAQYRHAYGSAGDVPDQLLALTSQDPRSAPGRSATWTRTSTTRAASTRQRSTLSRSFCGSPRTRPTPTATK
jgi:hypothetical protein